MKLPYALALAILTNAFSAQQNKPAPSPDFLLHAGTEEVLLDFIARDKHQKLVQDLRPEDVQIFEDGGAANPAQFRFSQRSHPECRHGNDSSQALAQSSYDPLRQINLVTIVFESMSPLSRRTATERAHEFLKAVAGPNTWMAVYSLRYHLTVQQTYTTDIALLDKAVDHAGTGAYDEFAKEDLNIIQRLNSLKAHDSTAPRFQPFETGSAQERGPQNDRDLARFEVPLQQLILKTLFHQEGNRSIDALRRLIREQARLPGRKTILFFSEGLVIPPDQPELLESVIAEANRNNVTFYTVDARGLTTVSNLRLSASTSQSIGAAEKSNSGLGEDGRPTEAIYQTDLQANARHLAQATGGFAMDNSNDLRGSLARVMEDVRSHYEVTYVPTSKNFDGHFRKLEVKLSRPALKVQSRTGYYAVPVLNGEGVAPFELAALNAMTMEPPPQSFKYDSAVLRFGEDCRIVFSVPGSSLHFITDAVTHSFHMRLSAFALIKDEHGQIVAKVGKDLPFTAPIERQANFASGKVTLTLPIHLQPGRYQIQTAVIDREADRASVKPRSVLIIPNRDPTGIAVGDVIWVRSLESIQAPDTGDLLDTSQGRITPDLSPSLTQKDSAAFYFFAFPPAEAKDQPAAQVTVTRDGKAIAALRLANPQPAEDGTYRYSGTLPLSQFEPGQYELTAAVTQNNTRAATKSIFEVR